MEHPGTNTHHKEGGKAEMEPIRVVATLAIFILIENPPARSSSSINHEL